MRKSVCFKYIILFKSYNHNTATIHLAVVAHSIWEGDAGGSELAVSIVYKANSRTIKAIHRYAL